MVGISFLDVGSAEAASSLSKIYSRANGPHEVRSAPPRPSPATVFPAERRPLARRGWGSKKSECFG
jgi:hypothetical protein